MQVRTPAEAGVLFWRIQVRAHPRRADIARALMGRSTPDRPVKRLAKPDVTKTDIKICVQQKLLPASDRHLRASSFLSSTDADRHFEPPCLKVMGPFG
jgi:hypothetical protein